MTLSIAANDHPSLFITVNANFHSDAVMLSATLKLQNFTFGEHVGILMIMALKLGVRCGFSERRFTLND